MKAGMGLSVARYQSCTNNHFHQAPGHVCLELRRHIKWRRVLSLKVSECLVWTTSVVTFVVVHSVMSNSLQRHGLQHTRLLCPSLSLGVCSNSGRSSQWFHPTIHPLSSPSPPAFNLSQHQGLFQSVTSLHPVAKVLELQLQHQSFQWIFRTDFL